MSDKEIHLKLTEVFRDVFDDNALEITAATTAADVPGWDSLTHINLICAIEKAFRLAFTTKEVKALTKVGDLVDLVARRAK